MNFTVGMPLPSHRFTQATPAEAEALACAGNPRGAITLATEYLREHSNSALERRIVQWRHQAFEYRDPSMPRKDWPPQVDDLLADRTSPPEIAPYELNSETLAAAIQHHGSLIVRDLIGPAQVSRLVRGIDRAFEDSVQQPAMSEYSDGTPWYSRFPFPADNFISTVRPWVEAAAGVLLADSPRMMFEFADVLEAIQIVPIVQGYLGERPALSIAKSTLRRVPKTMRLTGWHQDGAFLGPGIRSVNLWLCLSHCGENASGLDLVPKRIDHLVERGTHGAPLDWSVGEGMVEIVSHDAPVVSPVFHPGDAMLFDELLLHRTGIPKQMLHDRYAIESWFFAPSSYPMLQEPLFV